MGIILQDAIYTKAPRPADAKAYVGSGQHFANKDDIPLAYRFPRMQVKDININQTYELDVDKTTWIPINTDTPDWVLEIQGNVILASFGGQLDWSRIDNAPPYEQVVEPIFSAVTIPYGDPAYVSGLYPDLTIGVPEGKPGEKGLIGDDGIGATIAVGAVFAVNQGAEDVINVGTPTNAIFDFYLPKGDTGEGVPAGGATGQVLSKTDGVDYNTQWINQTGNIGASYWVDLLDTPSVYTGFSLGFPQVKADESGIQFITYADSLGARVRWKGGWVDAAYKQNDMVIALPYLGIANVDTTDTFPPVAEEQTQWLYGDTPTWSVETVVGDVATGLDIIVQNIVDLENYRGWILAQAGLEYTLALYKLESSRFVLQGSQKIEAGETLGWFILDVSQTISIVPGDRIRLVVINHAGNADVETPTEYTWQIGDTSTIAGNATINNANLIINVTDANPTDRTTLITSVKANDVITVAETGDLSRYSSYRATGASVIANGEGTIPALLVNKGGDLRDSRAATITFEIHGVAVNTDYVEIIDGLLNVDGFSGFITQDLSGLESLNLTLNNNTYGIDVNYRDYTTSTDWDYIPIGTGGGIINEGGGSSVTIINNLTTQDATSALSANMGYILDQKKADLILDNVFQGSNSFDQLITASLGIDVSGGPIKNVLEIYNFTNATVNISLTDVEVRVHKNLLPTSGSNIGADLDRFGTGYFNYLEVGDALATDKTLIVTGGASFTEPVSGVDAVAATDFATLQQVQQSSSGLQLGETHTTAYYGDFGKIAYDHTFLLTGNPHKVSYSELIGTQPVPTLNQVLTQNNDAGFKIINLTDGVDPQDAATIAQITALSLIYSKKYPVVKTINDDYSTLDTDADTILKAITGVGVVTLDIGTKPIGYRQQLLNTTNASIAIETTDQYVGNIGILGPSLWAYWIVLDDGITWGISIATDIEVDTDDPNAWKITGTTVITTPTIQGDVLFDGLISTTGIPVLDSEIGNLGFNDIRYAQNQEIAIGRYDEGNGFGYYPTGRVTANYGSIGAGALDLSYSDESSPTLGATGDLAFSMGYRTIASGYAAFSFGEGSVASGSYSWSMGYENVASGFNAISLGTFNNSTSNYTVVMGHSNDSGNGGGNLLSGVALQGAGADKTAFFGQNNILPTGNSYYLVVGNGTVIGDGSTRYVRDISSDALRVYRTGRIEAPSFEVNMILNDYDLTTKAYLDGFAKLDADNTFTGVNYFGVEGTSNTTVFYDYIQFQNQEGFRSGSFWGKNQSGLNKFEIEGVDELSLYSEGDIKLNADGSIWISKTIEELNAETNAQAAATLEWVADYVANNGGTGGGNVYKDGIPADTQVGVWTGDGTIEGTGSLTFDGTLAITNTLKSELLRLDGGTALSQYILFPKTTVQGVGAGLAYTDSIGIDRFSFIFKNDQVRLVNHTAYGSVLIEANNNIAGAANSVNVAWFEYNLLTVWPRLKVLTDPGINDDEAVGNRNYNDLRYIKIGDSVSDTQAWKISGTTVVSNPVIDGNASFTGIVLGRNDQITNAPALNEFITLDYINNLPSLTGNIPEFEIAVGTDEPTVLASYPNFTYNNSVLNVGGNIETQGTIIVDGTITGKSSLILESSQGSLWRVNWLGGVCYLGTSYIPGTSSDTYETRMTGSSWLSCNLAPIAWNAYTNKQYVDDNFLPITGGTITGDLTIEGTMNAASSYNSGSLRAIKKNIKPFTKSGLDLINDLAVVSYDMRYNSEKNRIGIIIDDTKKEFANDEHNAIRLTDTIFIQAKAIQELSAKLEKTEKRLEDIEKYIKEQLDGRQTD